MRAVRYPPPLEVTIRFVPLPVSRTAKAAEGIAALIRIGGTPAHQRAADDLVAAGQVATRRSLGGAHAR